MTREEIERRMDELAREYVETHDQKIIEELYKLALELGKMLRPQLASSLDLDSRSNNQMSKGGSWDSKSGTHIQTHSRESLLPTYFLPGIRISRLPAVR
jgi:hypothetical protein